jgi:hypothetical protein
VSFENGLIRYVTYSGNTTEAGMCIQQIKNSRGLSSPRGEGPRVLLYTAIPAEYLVWEGWAGDATRQRVFVVPGWSLVLFFVGGVLVLFMSGNRNANARHKGVHPCMTCGYCLTGNVSGLCPECGTPIPEEEKQAIAMTTTST